MKTILKKKIPTDKGKCTVSLKDDGFWYTVEVNKEVYKKTVNKMFAIQTFNAI